MFRKYCTIDTDSEFGLYSSEVFNVPCLMTDTQMHARITLVMAIQTFIICILFKIYPFMGIYQSGLVVVYTTEHPNRPIYKGKAQEDGTDTFLPIECPETSVNNYQSKQLKIPEDKISFTLWRKTEIMHGCSFTYDHS